MKVLIVEDSRAMRMMVKRTLRKAGVATSEIEEASTGAEALSKFDSFKPALVLCDWTLPDMNGMDVLNAIRAESATTKFGFVTSQVSSDVRSQAIEAGANFYLTKPFTAEGLQAALEKSTSATNSNSLAEDSSSVVETKRYLLGAEGVGELLSDLLGREVTLSTTKALPPEKAAVIASYARENDEMRGVIFADAALANFAGAALMLTPAAGAKDNANANKVPAAIMENFQEVLTVLGQVYNEQRSGAVWPKTCDLVNGATNVAPEVGDFVSKAAKRVDMDVVIDGYGTGTVTFFSM